MECKCMSENKCEMSYEQLREANNNKAEKLNCEKGKGTLYRREIKSLRQQLAEQPTQAQDKIDAERYRMLRKHNFVEWHYVDANGNLELKQGNKLDKAIDAAIANKKG